MVERHMLAKEEAETNPLFGKSPAEMNIEDLLKRGIVIVGDFFSPLKMLHFTMGPVNSVYFLMEQPESARRILDLHEKAQLDCIKQTGSAKNIINFAISLNLIALLLSPFNKNFK